MYMYADINLTQALKKHSNGDHRNFIENNVIKRRLLLIFNLRTDMLSLLMQ
jgi:hypothetical protein